MTTTVKPITVRLGMTYEQLGLIDKIIRESPPVEGVSIEKFQRVWRIKIMGESPVPDAPPQTIVQTLPPGTPTDGAESVEEKWWQKASTRFLGTRGGG